MSVVKEILIACMISYIVLTGFYMIGIHITNKNLEKENLSLQYQMKEMRAENFHLRNENTILEKRLKLVEYVKKISHNKPGAEDIVEYSFSQPFCDPYLVLAVIWTESTFDFTAHNDLFGARGLMQIIPGTDRFLKQQLARIDEEFSTRNLIERQIMKGSFYLAYMTKKAGSVRGGILSYNAGFGNFRKGNANTDYYEKVMRRYNDLKGFA